MEIIAMDLKDLKEKMAEDGTKMLFNYSNTFVKPMDNFSSMVITANKTGESVFIQETYGKKNTEIVEKEIKFDDEGQAYFNYKDAVHYASDFVRIKILENFGKDGRHRDKQ